MTTLLSAHPASETDRPAHTAERSSTSTKETSRSARTGAAPRTRRLRNRSTSRSSSRQRTPMNERILTGEGSHHSLLALAQKHYRLRYPAVQFVNEVFAGDDPLPLQRARPSHLVTRPLIDGTLTRAEVRAYALEWDALGVTRPETFIEAFECEVLGTERGDAYQKFMIDLSADKYAAIEFDPDTWVKPHWAD